MRKKHTSYRTLPTSLRLFWERAPLLGAGLNMAVGVGVAQGRYYLLVLLLPLWIVGWRSALRGAVLVGCGWLLVCALHRLPPPSKPISGEAELRVDRVCKRRGTFNEFYAVRGLVKKFTAGGEIVAANLPVSVYVSTKQPRPLADRVYKLSAILAKGRSGHYLKVSRRTEWKPVRKVFGLGELRWSLKTKIARVIGKKVSDKRAAALLSGLVTGDLYDASATAELGRLGLAHLLAISGLHFTLVALALRLLLRPFLPRRLARCILILGVTSYFLFIDAGPAALRAWTMACVFLAGELLGRRPLSLNLLGGALILCLLLRPLAISSLGFVFSFCCSGAILLFYPLFEGALRPFIASSPLATVSAMSKLDQHLFLVTSLFRRALSLSLAVNAAALPLTLFFFHRFPLLGLIYNLFFPCVVGVALIFALLGLLLYPLASPLLFVAEKLVQLLLVTVRELPSTFDFAWRTARLDVWTVTLLLTTLFCAGIWLSDFRWNHKTYLPIA